MKSQQEKICDGKTDMRIADEKIEGLMRGTEEGEKEEEHTAEAGLSLFMLIQSFY